MKDYNFLMKKFFYSVKFNSTPIAGFPGIVDHLSDLLDINEGNDDDKPALIDALSDHIVVKLLLETEFHKTGIRGSKLFGDISCDTIPTGWNPERREIVLEMLRKNAKSHGFPLDDPNWRETLSMICQRLIKHNSHEIIRK